MKWTDDKVKQLIELRDQELTSTEIAEKLTAEYQTHITGAAVRRALNRRGLFIKKVGFNEDGVQSNTTIVKTVNGEKMTPKFMLDAHGYDHRYWEIMSSTDNVWKQTQDTTSYQSKITVRPKVGLSSEDFSEIANEIEPTTIDRKEVDSERNLVVPLPDMHFGWTTYDDVADKVQQIRRTIKNGYDNIVVAQLGDLFHSDQVHSSQTVSGTLLDHVNMRQAFKDAMQLFADILPLALTHANHVMIKSVFGNHSGDLEYSFLYALQAKYPQVEIDFNDDNPATDWRTAFRLGHVGFMLAHGDVARNKLVGLFPTEYKEIWYLSKTAELMTGHYHSERFKDDQGIMWRQLGTPKPHDPYEIKNGFTSSKKVMYLFEYDDERLRCTYEL